MIGLRRVRARVKVRVRVRVRVWRGRQGCGVPGRWISLEAVLIVGV